MKKLIVAIALTLVALTATANPIRYFTRSQAARVVSYLNSQDELMIYCGYQYEIETYVIISDVWAEPFNSAYYEVWIYGFDAYTGDEIYMPLDLGCVWLFGGNKLYSAARYLRFRTEATVPPITWYVPAYNRFTRIPHRTGYVRTYHYDVHTYGWYPPAPPRPGYTPAPGYVAYPPYYTRTPQTPAPRPENSWTPGYDKPVVVTGRSSSSTSERPSARTSSGDATVTTSSRSGNNTSTTTSSSRSGNNNTSTTTSSSRSGSTTSTSSRGTTSTSTSSSSRGTTSTSTSSSSRGTTSTSTSSSSRGTTTTSSRSSR